LVFINADFNGANNGDKVLEFWANTTSGTVWFNISGFINGRNYRINRSGSTIDTVTANSTGNISFSNNVWSEKLFEIFQTTSSAEPQFGSVNTPDGTTGDSLIFNVSVTDDNDTYSELTVRVNWSHNGTNSNDTMTGHADNTFTRTVTVGHNISNISFFFYANDTDANLNQTSVFWRNVTDNDVPIAVCSNLSYQLEDIDIIFNASSSADNIGIHSYKWDWDNDSVYENTTTNATINYTYADPANYTAVLWVNDSADNNDTCNVTVHVQYNISWNLLYNESAGGGLNFFGIMNETNASAIASALGDNCSQVLRWNPTIQSWVAYIPDVSTLDMSFSLQSGDAVSVEIDSNRTYYIKGYKPRSQVNLTYNATAGGGLNWLGRTDDMNSSGAGSNIKANDISDNLTDPSNCNQILQWNATIQSFVAYIPGISGEELNFDVLPGLAVCIEVKDDETLTQHGW
jgi:hypothetical protein